MPMRVFRMLMALVTGAASVAGCASPPTSPEPINILDMGGSAVLSVAAGSTTGAGIFIVNVPTALMSNVQCFSNTGDPVTVELKYNLDFEELRYHYTFHPVKVGPAAVTCTAEPRASGTKSFIVVDTPLAVSMSYVRRTQAGVQPEDPTTTGMMEIDSNFRVTDGAANVRRICRPPHLVWNTETLTLTCDNSFVATAVNVTNAACVDDPAAQKAGFQGGAIFVNGTLLTTIWAGSSPAHQCALFSIDPAGKVGPPK
jgi:hypothetical protein